MVKRYSEHLDRTFFALSDPTRRAILTRLSSGEATVLKLAEPFNLSVPAISKHLRLLESAHLITRKKQGKVHYIRLNPTPIEEASGWIASHRARWELQLDNLEAYLNGIQEKDINNKETQTDDNN